MESQRNFVGQKHTIKYLRAGEILMTKLADRQSFAEWERSGHEGMAKRSIIEVERILAEHEVPPLDSYQELQVDEIMEAAAVELE